MSHKKFFATAGAVLLCLVLFGYLWLEKDQNVPAAPVVSGVPAQTATPPKNTAPPKKAEPPQAATAPVTAPPNTPDDASADEEAESDPWEEAWANQRQYYRDLLTNTDKLIASLPTIFAQHRDATDAPAKRLRRMFILSEAYAHKPRALEAILYQIRTGSEDMHTALAPAQRASEEAQDLLKRLTRVSASVPAEQRTSRTADAQARAFFKQLDDKIARLTKDKTRLNALLAPSTDLLANAEQHIEAINTALPDLWKDEYLAPPVRYFDEEHWSNIPQKLQETLQTARMALTVDMPQTEDDWTAALVRFGVVLAVLGMLTFIAFRRLVHYKMGEAYKHIFRTSLPWIIVGFASLATAFVARQGVYQDFLGFASLFFIIGQIALAWDLRRINHTEASRTSPLWPLCVPALTGYILLYPAMPIVVLAGSWMLILSASLAWQYLRQRKTPPLELEAALVRLNHIALWTAVLLLLFGAPRYSILFYLAFVSIAVAVQLCMGGMHLIHTISTKYTAEGIRGACANLLISLAAPALLVTITCGMSLWVGSLPGGYLLLREYATATVHIAGTSFNILHLLMIISVFYVTRACIGIGLDMLDRLQEREITIDNTLIQPLQTALRYTAWGLFGLFVLKSLGMELSNLAVVAGGLSVGIGFGMQAIVNNFLSGLILIFSRTLQEGDVIDVGGLHGVVRKISVRATTVETFDNAVIYVPNAEFVSSRLINWTRNSRSIRREINVGVAYGTDTELVMRLLRQAADGLPDVLKYPQPTVLFTDFGNSTLNFSLRFWVGDYDRGASTASALRLQIEKVFRAHAVEIAFPQLDVHIKEKQGISKTRLALPSCRKPAKPARLFHTQRWKRPGSPDTQGEHNEIE